MYNPRTNTYYKEINIAREINKCKECDSYVCTCQLSLEDWLRKD